MGMREDNIVIHKSMSFAVRIVGLYKYLRPHPTKNVNAGAVCFRGNFAS